MRCATCAGVSHSQSRVSVRGETCAVPLATPTMPRYGRHGCGTPTGKDSVMSDTVESLPGVLERVSYDARYTIQSVRET